MLTIARSIMNKVHEHENVVFFSPEASVEDARTNLEAPSLAIHKTRWEDMGRPEVVTVVIEPGDKLNP